MFVLNSRLQLVNAARASLEQRGTPYPLLLIGPNGVGKRIFARAFAAALGWNFIETNMVAISRVTAIRTSPSDDVDQYFWRYIEEALQIVPVDESLIIYVSNLEQTHVGIHRALHTLVTKNKVRGRDGVFRPIGADCVVVGGYQTGTIEPVVTLDGWLLSAFEDRIWLTIKQVQGELPSLVEHFASQKGVVVKCTAPGSLLAELAGNSEDGIEGLRRWVDATVSASTALTTLSEQQLLDAAVTDVRYLVRQINFRGQLIPEDRVQGWIGQFPKDLQPHALHMFREIARRYFIDDAKYYPALEMLIQATKLRKRASVRFCRWQQTGRSAPRVAHEIKNLAGWRVLEDVDIEDPQTWPSSTSLPSRLVLVDDFVGTGSTVSALFNGGKNSLVGKLATKYKGGRLYLLIVAGYESAIQSLRAAAKQYDSFLSISVGILYSEEDRCFSDNSRIFSRLTARQVLRNYCEKLAEEQFLGLRPEHRLGFGGVGSLVVFSHTVPNNTVPPIWYDEATDWKPLFPASGLLS